LLPAKGKGPQESEIFQYRVYHLHMANNGNTSEHIYTPSELNREVRMHIEMGFPRILLEAEISNLSKPASGHLYFTLKDNRAQIRCALFRSSASRLSIRPENGMKVLARGRISLYEPRGDFQLIVDSLRDAGEGLLRRQFEELKKKLEGEGLFDPTCKQPLPPYPLRIGVVTSPGGAAVRDILHVLERRWPVAKVRLYPVSVQGTEAPREILTALQAANEQNWAEILIVGRGGGSLEDLFAFNDEAVVRAVFASGIPVISAVGHETDFSICDFVADLRAPTPSAAAELATPNQAALKESFARNERQLLRLIRDRLQRDTQGLDHLSHRLQQRHPATRLGEQVKRLDTLQKALTRSYQRQLKERETLLASLDRRLHSQHPGRRLRDLRIKINNIRQSIDIKMNNTLNQQQQKLRDLARTLNAVSPLNTIGRGYAVITSTQTGKVISSVSQTQPGEPITTQLSDGRLLSTVDQVTDQTLDSECLD
jgi:exodeoxyribonuclease VII large subunit